MKKETTQKRKRVSKAARQKQKLMIVGGLGIVLVLLIFLAIFVLSSCGTDYAGVGENTVFVSHNGKIVSTDVEAFDEKSYDKDELEAYLKDVIDTYNKENGKNSIKQKSFDVEDGKAVLVLEYASADIYEDFNGIEFFTGTIKEAKEAGYSFEGNFAKLKDGKAITASAEDFVDSEDYKIIIIKSNTNIALLSGEIAFVSTENVAKADESYVVIKDGSQLITEEITLDTEFGTEAEGSDGSISEEELLGEGEIIFDFGEEEEQGSQYSEVLTYIIYK